MEDSGTETPNRMARRKGRTRKKLMDAAAALVLEKGYEDVMTDEITDLADVGRRTFYNHFTNKRECVLGAVKERYQKYVDGLAEAIAQAKAQNAIGCEDPAQVITIMASQMFQLVANDPLTEKLMLYPRILNEAVSDSQRDHMAADVAQGVVSGRFKPSILSPEALEPMITWSFVGLVMASIERNSQQADSLVWTRYLLSLLSIDEGETEKLLALSSQTDITG